MPTQYQKLSDLLKQLFQSDQADLDFGIYRIINQPPWLRFSSKRAQW